MKPTVLSLLPQASGSSPLHFSHPQMGFSAGKQDEAQGEGRAEQEASEAGLGSGLISAPALSTMEPALQSGAAGARVVSGDPGAEPWAAGAARCDFSKACGRRHSRWPRLQSTPGSQGWTQKTKFRCAGASWQMPREVLHHSLQAEPGPLCPAGRGSALLYVSQLCVRGGNLQDEPLCQSGSAVWS